jgi:hypothetical protein
MSIDASGEAPPESESPKATTKAHAWAAGLFLLISVGIAARLVTLPRIPDVDDSFAFIRGVIRYSIRETRPHWTGYPVYMWVGKLVDAIVGDPTFALHLVSAIASALTAWPLAAITRAWAQSLGSTPRLARRAGWAAAALWLVTPMSWVTGSQIVSDPLGLLVGATFVACAVAGERTGDHTFWVGAAVLAGLDCGIRIVNLTMFGPLIWKAWQARRERWWRARLPVGLALGLAAGALPWIGWIAVREPSAFVERGQSHISGHFRAWGNSILTDDARVSRPWRAARTVAFYGLGAGGPDRGRARVAAGVGWLVALALALMQRPFRGYVSKIVLLWSVPHLVYVFLAHDVGYPRYVLSAVALLSVLGGLPASRPDGRALAAVVFACVFTGAVSGPLAALQRDQPASEYQVTRFLSGQARAAVFITDAPDLPLYLADMAPDVKWVAGPASQVPEFRARWEQEGRQVFATAPPPQDPSGWVPVAHFCRDPAIDPRLGHDLWVFSPGAATVAHVAMTTNCAEE